MASRIIPNVHTFARSRAVFHKIPINPVSVNFAFYTKYFSTSSPTYNAETDPSLNFSPSGSPSQVRRGKWLSTIKTRVGKCVFHGMRNEEISEAASILADLSKNWREYVAGSEGFLTGEHRRGLFRHSVVWGDMDSMGNFPVFFRSNRHVNNVTYVRWAESARILWALNYAYYIDPLHAEEWKKLSTPKDIGMILKSIKVDYKFPMEWPDKVSVYHKLNTIDSESFTLDVMILSEKTQRPAARCLEDIVIYDYKVASKAPVPDWVRNQFNKTLRLQNEAAASAHKAMKDVEKRVDNLERKVLSREEEK